MYLLFMTIFLQCTKDQVPVESISLNKTTLILTIGTSETLLATTLPENASSNKVTWASSNSEIASVDFEGKVLAKKVGEATITATTKDGGKTAICEVKTTKYALYPLGNGKYEQGVKVAGIVWAPVNCGFEAPNGDYKGYPYGKLYQWGRKYGHGYNGPLYINETTNSSISDATYPTKESGTIISGQVSFNEGNSEINKNNFYYLSDTWCTESLTEWSHSKGNDPCPDGWRLPTYEELKLLSDGKKSDFTTDESGLNGYYFTGNNDYSPNLENKVFFPAAGCRFYENGKAYYRGNYGIYWSSSIYNANDSHNLSFLSFYVCMLYDHRAYGFSVRCVEDL